MALTDINFQQGEGQDFILTRPTGTLNSPLDIVAEQDGAMYPVLETKLVASSGGGNIFIIND